MTNSLIRATLTSFAVLFLAPLTHAVDLPSLPPLCNQGVNCSIYGDLQGGGGALFLPTNIVNFGLPQPKMQGASGIWRLHGTPSNRTLRFIDASVTFEVEDGVMFGQNIEYGTFVYTFFDRIYSGRDGVYRDVPFDWSGTIRPVNAETFTWVGDVDFNVPGRIQVDVEKFLVRPGDGEIIVSIPDENIHFRFFLGASNPKVLLGDIDGNCSVGAGDMNFIVINFGNKGPKGDLNLDGEVSIRDLYILWKYWGNSCRS